MAGSTVRNGRQGRRLTAWAVRATAAAACGTLALTACGSTKDTGASSTGGGTGKVGVILPLLTSPFWQSYNDYVPKMAKSEGVQALKTVNSNSDPSQQITDINNELNQGVKGLMVTPLDSAAIVADAKAGTSGLTTAAKSYAWNVQGRKARFALSRMRNWRANRSGTISAGRSNCRLVTCTSRRSNSARNAGKRTRPASRCFGWLYPYIWRTGVCSAL